MSRSAFQKLADPFFLDVAPDETIDHPAWCEALAAARHASRAGVDPVVIGGDGTGRSLLAAVLRAEGLHAETAPAAADPSGATDPSRARVPMRKATSDELGVFLAGRLSASGLPASLLDDGARRLIAERADGSVAEASRLAGLALADAGRRRARHVRVRHVRRILPKRRPGPKRAWMSAVAAAVAAFCWATVPFRGAGPDRAPAPPHRVAFVTANAPLLPAPTAPAPALATLMIPAPTLPVAVAGRPAPPPVLVAPVATPAPAPAVAIRQPRPPVARLVRSAPATPLPPDRPPPLVIVLRFDEADAGARDRAARLATALSAIGVADVEPVGVPHALPDAVGYGFAEDRDTAIAIRRAIGLLDDRTLAIRPGRDRPDGTDPGVIDVSVGD